LSTSQAGIRFRLLCWMGGVAIAAVGVTACRQQMADQPRYKPLTRSTFFGDERSARPLVAGTVARGHLQADEHLFTGKVGGRPAETFPSPVTRQVLERGQERYNIFCAPCHDRVGNGEGMVVRRGFRPPPSFHMDRLRTVPPGYFFEVITNGFGTMANYAAEVPARDRWAIVAYIRALQLSQQARLVDVPAEERHRLPGAGR